MVERRAMIRILKFFIALILSTTAMAEVGWITIYHPWLTKGYRALLKAFMVLLYLV